MNANIRLKNALETIAQRAVPADTNLWPRIAAHLEQKEPQRMNTKWKLTWIVVLAALGLILATTAAYALYQYFNDPGLKSAGEAGLITELEVTARPTPLPTATPLEPAIQVGEEQNLEAITVTLDWVYLNDARQSFGFSARGLPAEVELGMPQMGFGELIPMQYRGAGLELQGSAEVITGTYVVNQIVRDSTYDGHTEGHANVGIDIPIVDKAGKPLKTFHFEVMDAPLHLGPVSGSNVYATRSNGIELRLEWIKLTPLETQARLCTDNTGGQDWGIQSAVLQLAGTIPGIVQAPPVQSQPAIPSPAENGARCTEITFPVGGQGAGVLHLAVSQLANPSGQTLEGTWTFDWSQLPGGIPIPGLATPTPEPTLASQVVGDMKATLLQAYADANRLAFVVQIENLPPGSMLDNVVLVDAQGNGIPVGYSTNTSKTEPSTFDLTISSDSSLSGDRFTGQLVLGIGPVLGDNATTEFRFDLDLPIYPAVILKPQQAVTANGIEMRLELIKVTPSYTQVGLCYQKPSSSDWGIGRESLLQIGADQTSLDSYGLVYDAAFGQMGAGFWPDWTVPANTGRCVVVGFPVGHHNRPETLILTLTELEQSFPEMIPDDQIQMARQKLRQEGIEMDWVVSFGNGGGGAGPVITQKPAGMTDEQVLRRFYEILGYYYPGPWRFEVPVAP